MFVRDTTGRCRTTTLQAVRAVAGLAHSMSAMLHRWSAAVSPVLDELATSRAVAYDESAAPQLIHVLTRRRLHRLMVTVLCASAGQRVPGVLGLLGRAP